MEERAYQQEVFARRQPFVNANMVISRRTALPALGAAFLLTGLGRPPPARAAARLRIGGTGMALAAMRQVADAFTAGTPGAEFEILPSLGTGGGLAAVAAGAIELSLSARPLSEAEQAKGLRSKAYARTPIAFATHASNLARDITIAQIVGILSGETTAWPKGTPVRLVRREPSDADWTMLRNLSPEMGRAVEVALRRPGLLTVATDQENADTLERLHGSFGAISIGQLRAENRHLNCLALDGVMPDLDALASRRYPLERTLRAVWREPPDTLLARFIDFLRSREADDILGRLGHLPPAGASS